jgi:hypothetical protein
MEDRKILCGILRKIKRFKENKNKITYLINKIK